jgi:hypothetical protein
VCVCVCVCACVRASVCSASKNVDVRTPAQVALELVDKHEFAFDKPAFVAFEGVGIAVGGTAPAAAAASLAALGSPDFDLGVRSEFLQVRAVRASAALPCDGCNCASATRPAGGTDICAAVRQCARGPTGRGRYAARRSAVRAAGRHRRQHAWCAVCRACARPPPCPYPCVCASPSRVVVNRSSQRWRPCMSAAGDRLPRRTSLHFVCVPCACVHVCV